MNLDQKQQLWLLLHWYLKRMFVKCLMLISRLEKINLMYGSLDGSDTESTELVMVEIKALEAEKNYFFTCFMSWIKGNLNGTT